MLQESVIFLCVCVTLHFSTATHYDPGNEFLLQNVKQWQSTIEESPKASDMCKTQFNLWLELLQKEQFMADNWAWRMLDAWDKINPGILTGNTVGLGQMDECLAIDEIHEGVDIKGQYCYSGLPISLGDAEANSNFAMTQHALDGFRNMMGMGRGRNKEETQQPINYMMSICVPHECNWMEITGMSELSDLEICQTKETLKEYDGGDWAFVVFFIVVVILVLLSSCYDWYIRHNNLKPVHPVTLAFSFYTNSEKLLKISNNSGQFQSLNGIRAISMMWVLTGHRFNSSIMVPTVNMEYVMDWMGNSKSFYVTSAPVAVDSFFFLSGIVMAYGFMKSQSKPNARFNIILYYLHRYLRLTPAVGVIYFLYVTWYKHVSSGPMWPLLIQQDTDNCLNNAMSFFLYIQNIINPKTLCLSHTWYLQVDMQYFIISPIILIPMVKWPKYAGYGLVGLILLSILPPTLVTYFLELTSYHPDYVKHYYYQPYTRASPWLVGLLLGYLFYQLRDRKIKIHWVLNLFIWLIILVGIFFILYMAPETMATTDVTTFAVYNGFHRLCWALGLMWIVFACEKGYGGIVNWFLTLPIFQVLARLSYSMYLLHVFVQLMASTRKRSPQFFDDYEMLNQAFGDIIVVTFLAFFYCMMFESPMVVVEKILFGPNGYIHKLFGLGRKTEGRSEKPQSSAAQVIYQNKDNVGELENGITQVLDKDTNLISINLSTTPVTIGQ